MGMRFQHRDCSIDVAPAVHGQAVALVHIDQECAGSVELVTTSFTSAEWRTMSRHVEEALREAALLRRRAKSAERRKRDAMKGTR